MLPKRLQVLPLMFQALPWMLLVLPNMLQKLPTLLQMLLKCPSKYFLRINCCPQINPKCSQLLYLLAPKGAPGPVEKGIMLPKTLKLLNYHHHMLLLIKILSENRPYKCQSVVKNGGHDAISSTTIRCLPEIGFAWKSRYVACYTLFIFSFVHY